MLMTKHDNKPPRARKPPGPIVKKPKPKQVRRSRLQMDPGVERILLAVIAVGGSQVAACRTAGIDRGTLNNWRIRGEAGEEPFASFMVKFRKAQEAAKVKYLRVIQQCAEDGDWRAAAWGLTKLYPSEFGERVTASVEVSAGPDLTKLTDEELEQWRALMEKTR